MMDRQSMGYKGEEISCCYLKKKGYKILARNYRVRLGEIDIIAMDRKTLVFVEVKTRSDILFGLPCEAVNYKKQTRMKKAARRYLSEEGAYYEDIRFDVIEVLLENNYIHHMENAFL